MMHISHKAKQFLVLLGKILIVGLAVGFIYHKLSTSDVLDAEKLTDIISTNFSIGAVVLLLLLSFLNRFFEILKWRNLADLLQNTSVFQATKQVLSALVFSIFTPNGIGEYGAKALFFKKENVKEVVFLNFVCNGIQMFITVFFGLLGLFLLGYYSWFSVIFGALVALVVLVVATKKITIKGYSLQRLIEKIKEVPIEIHKKNSILGVFRFLFFSHQNYFLLVLFGVEVDYLLLISTIAAVYFLASCLPNFQFLDFAVKGGVAVYFFGLLGVNEWIVTIVTLLMWFLNVVLPVVIGLFFVLTFKINLKSVKETV